MKLSLLTTALTAILFTASCLHSPAQVLHATRTHYSTENGLSSNSIADIVQDDLGYVWLATWNGLSRFDGYTFYNYKTGAGSHIHNLHNRIRSLLADMQQNIWLRMYDGRIFVMKRSIDRIINPLEGINGYEDFRTDIPLSIASNGDVLASIDGQGIYCFRITPQGIEPQLFTTSGLVITCMAEGYKGDIWLGTDQGIHLLDPSNMTVKREGPFQDEVITSMFSDHYNIYAGTESGKVVTFAYGAEPRVIYEGSRPVNGIFVDSHKLIWFTDDRQGALRINPSTGDVKYFVQELTMPDYDALGGFFNETKEEGADTTYSTLWVRMNHGGYGYYNRQTDEIEYFHNDPTNPWNLCNTVNASLELDEGVIFESTARRGLEKLEIVKNTIQRKLMVPEASSTLENEIRAIYYDEQRHRLLIGNKSHTLNFYNDNFEVVSTISHDDQGNPIGRCYGISKDTKGNYWLSSKDNGLFCITPQGNDTYSVKNICHDDQDINSLSSNATYATVEDRQGNIWVATYGGGANVLAKDKNGHTVFFHPKNGMVGYPYRSHLKVRTIEADCDGNVWAGTTDGILIMSYANGSVNVKKLEESQEYPDSILMSNDIVCLARDSKGMMWIGTNGGGLACTTGKDSKGRWLFRNYGSKDGLPCEEIKSITFDAKGNALIFFNGKVYENGHFSIASEIGHTLATENIAQQKKYNASHRFHLDYFFGACRWITPNRNPTKMEALNNISAKLAYSPIMNDRIGAGFGAQIHLNSYLFSSPNTNLTSTDGALTLEGYNSPSNGSWESEMLITSIDLPIHFTYFPNKNKHSTNLQLELIPQFILNNTFTRNFNTTVSDQNISASYAQDVPANHFQLMARLSANFGMLGVYTEVGLTPIVNDILFPPPAVPFSPHHIAFGFRINLFNALAD